jgi:hypothetical protein
MQKTAGLLAELGDHIDAIKRHIAMMDDASLAGLCSPSHRRRHPPLPKAS